MPGEIRLNPESYRLAAEHAGDMIRGQRQPRNRTGFGVQFAHLPALLRCRSRAAFTAAELEIQENEPAAGELHLLRRVEPTVRHLVMDFDSD